MNFADFPASSDEISADIFADRDEDLISLWRSYVQKVKVVEMLHALNEEQTKLKILKKHTDLDQENEDEVESESQKGSVDVASPYTRTSRVSYASNFSKVHHRSQSSLFSQRSGLSDREYSKRKRRSISEKEFLSILDLCEDKLEQNRMKQAFDEKKARGKYLHKADEQRKMLYFFINSGFFVKFMLATIFLSTFAIFLQTFETIEIRFSYFLILLDACIIAIFVVEATLKVIIYRGDYFIDMWNILDMTIVTVHFTELSVDVITSLLALNTDINASIEFKFLKSLRALRLLRVIKFLPNLQIIVATIFQSLLSILSIATLMYLFIFVFAVVGTSLFNEHDPDHFGTFWLALVTLFQLLTLDDWFNLLDKIDPDKYPFQYWLFYSYLFCYILIEFFVFLNLFVAVLVDNFQLSLAEAEIEQQKIQLLQQEKLNKYDALMVQDEEEEAAFLEVNAHGDDVCRKELNVEDYYSFKKGSAKSKIVSEIFKDLATLDLERYIHKRRYLLLNSIWKVATGSKLNSWNTSDTSGFNSQLPRAETGQSAF